MNYVTANILDNQIDKGSNKITTNPYHQPLNATASEASSIISDKTPAITAFLIFSGEFIKYALLKGLNITTLKNNKYGISA